MLMCNTIRIFCINVILSLSQIEGSVCMKNEQKLWPWNTSSGTHQIYFLEKGSGSKHIVLIHGFGAHTYTWRHLIDPLADAGYHVWSFDLIGFGKSDKPTHLQYDRQLFVHQIEKFMAVHKIHSAILVGNSMGGGLALSMALEHPACVQSLILIDPFVLPIKLPYYFAFPKIFGKLTLPFFGRRTVMSLLKDVTYDPKKISDEQIEAYTLPFRTRQGKVAFIKTLQSLDNDEISLLAQGYKNLTMPIFVIWGEKDVYMPSEYQQQAAQLMPQAQTVVIPACGHIPQEESPQEVLKSMLRFLKKFTIKAENVS